jgi:hypothetical protein
MQKKHGKSMTALNKIIDLVDQILSHSNVPTDEFSLVTAFLLSKFYKSMLSIRVLSSFGLEEDSKALLRILFEQLLNLFYISKEPQIRTKLFVEYNKIERINFLEKLKKHYPSTYSSLDTEQKNKIVEDYEEIKQKYDRYKGWSGKSIRKMAEDLGSDALYWYDIIYSAESIYVHSTVNSSKNFLLKEDDIVNIKVGPYPFNATDLYSKAIELARDMLKQALINWGKDVTDVMNTWEECKILLEQEFKEFNIEGDAIHGV